MNEFDTTLSFCLLSWMTELCFFVAGFLFGAKRVITTKSFAPELLVTLIAKYNVSLKTKQTKVINIIENKKTLLLSFR